MKYPILAIVLLFTSTVFGQDTDPVATSELKYALPQSVKDAEVGGTVIVDVRVGETGTPVRAAVVAGPMWPCGTKPTQAIEELSSTLSESIMRLRFRPAMKNGKPLEKDMGFKLVFKNPKLASYPDLDPTTGKSRPKQINAGVMNGKAKHLSIPAYPMAARANGDQGVVLIETLIDEAGKVVYAGAVSGAPTLQLSARDAACKSKFSTTSLDGIPVRVAGLLTYNFVP